MTALTVSDALVEILRAAHGPQVWVSVPDNTQPPYTVIGQFNSEPIGGKGSKAEWHIVEIIEWVVGPSRAPLSVRMQVTKDALNDVLITFDGVAPFTPVYQPGASDELHDDGITWSGSQRFKILGQPAA